MVNTTVTEGDRQKILEKVKEDYRILYLDLPPTKSYLKKEKWRELGRFCKRYIIRDLFQSLKYLLFKKFEKQ